MPKKPLFSNPALKKSKTSRVKEKQFNIVANTNSFSAVFDLQKLDSQEEGSLKGILHDNWITDNLSKSDVEKNFQELKSITSEIKSISRQGAFLVGERVVKAREMLKPYRDGTFTLWLESTFGSRRSGYNMLAYYELFKALPDESLKTKYKTMAQKAAYSLANRKGDIQKKIEIIDQHFNLKSRDLILLVQKEFSNHDPRSRRTITGLIRRLLETVDQLSKKSRRISVEDLEDIKYAKSRLIQILKK
jgi:hypothetical protein